MAYWWQVDSLTINTGSIHSGAIADARTDNGIRLVLNELAAAPGFDYTFTFENIPGSVEYFRFVMNGYYDASIYFSVNAYVWNYNFGLWVNAGVIEAQSGDVTYYWQTLPTAFGWTSGGQAKICFVQESTGNTGNKFRVDMLRLTDMTFGNTTHAPTTLVPTTAAPTAAPTTLAPTTVGPTTIAPTTLAATTTVPTTTLTTPPPPTTPPPRDRENDVTFNCRANNYAGVLLIEITIGGHFLSATYGLADLELSIPITITGEVPFSALHRLVDLELAIETSIIGWGVANEEKKNWVGWSKIGDVSFELDLVNDAGFRPMSWSGYVYQTLKLDKNVVIYGSNGVTMAYPVTSPMPTFGFKELLPIGVKNKTAVAGDEFTHFFIDILGCLYKIASEGLSNLGFEEFLLSLVNPILTWDAAKSRLYISDASVGYIYNDSTLTGGYANLTGLYRIKDNLTAVSPGDVIADPVEICTDIIDFKRRGLKSIESMQFDAISEVLLYAAIDYRYDKKKEFKTTQWSPLNSEGVAHIRTAGVDFRIRLKGLDHGTFDLSYISVQFKFIDQRFTRDPKGEIDDY